MFALLLKILSQMNRLRLLCGWPRCQLTLRYTFISIIYIDMYMDRVKGGGRTERRVNKSVAAYLIDFGATLIYRRLPLYIYIYICNRIQQRPQRAMCHTLTAAYISLAAHFSPTTLHPNRHMSSTISECSIWHKLRDGRGIRRRWVTNSGQSCMDPFVRAKDRIVRGKSLEISCCDNTERAIHL